MSDSDFIAYVGDPDIHDGRIATAAQRNGDYVVEVTTMLGRTIRIRFIDCQHVKSNDTVGMLLYGLTELKNSPPWRRFVFANWDDDDDAMLEIVAKDVQFNTSR